MSDDYIDFTDDDLHIETLSDELINQFDASEFEDYLIIPDPDDPPNEDLWCLMLLKEPFNDIIIRTKDIVIEGEKLRYTWDIVFDPDKEKKSDYVHFMNVLNSCVISVLKTFKRDGALGLYDEEGNKIE